MKVTVVGMWDDFPQGNKPVSGYLIEKDGFIILLDVGNGVAAHIQKYINIHDIHHIILNRYHHTHIEDLEAFILARKISRQLERRERNLNLYGPESGEIEKLIRWTKYSNYHPVKVGTKYEIGPFKIDFHRNLNSEEGYSVRVMDHSGTTLIYTSDSSCHGSLVRFAFGADLLITDCNMYDGYDSHMNAEAAGRLAAKADASLTLLSNLPHHGEPEVLLDSATQHSTGEIRLAEVGMVENI